MYLVIIGLCETWVENNDCFYNFLDSYTTLNNVRRKKKNAFRYSGGICVLIKDTLAASNYITCIYEDMKEYIVLLLNGQNVVNQKDIIIVFTYVAPEKSTFYDDPETNGIELLADKLLSTMSESPNADLLFH